MALERGTRLGPYQIESPIGAGGMGEVYKATDTRLERTVAIKVLPAHVASDPERKARFEREAKVISGLNHPHICTLYEFDNHDGTDFLVMEYLEGETLAERLQKGALPLDQALRYAIEIADALDKAHRQGVTHRDLKPANIMLTKAGAKLLDFGLAKLTPTAPQSDASTKLADALTEQGTILGTFQYMAPEQLEGGEADHRTDIWAFGCVVYEMVTGQKAFEGKTQASLIGAILKDEPRTMSSLQPMSPYSLDQIVQVCLAKDADERWQSAGDIGRQLKLAAETGTVHSAAAPTRILDPGLPGWRQAVPLTLTVSLVVGAITGVSVWTFLTPEPRPVTRTSIVLPRTQQGSGRVAISPTGSHVVYTVGSVVGRDPLGSGLVQDGPQRSNQGLYLRPLDELQAEWLQATEGRVAWNPFFSPDGQWIAFFSMRDNALQKIAISGGSAVTVAAVFASNGGTWAADDTIVFAQDGQGILRVAARGGTPELIVPVERPAVAQRPQLLPGEEVVLYTRAESEALWGSAQILAEHLGTGQRTVLVEGGSDARYVPTGHLVYALGGTLMAVPFDAERIEVTGGPVPVVEGVRSVGGGAMSADISPAGTLVYTPGRAGYETRALVWVDRTGREEPLDFAPAEYNTPRVSPDGTRVAVTQTGPEGTDIWILDLARGSATKLTADVFTEANPLWTTDGAGVVYGSFGVDEGMGLFLKSADGTGDSQRLMTASDETVVIGPSSWSPNGEHPAFWSVGAGAADIGLLSLNGNGTPEALLASSFGEQVPAISPDGRWMAYESNETGRVEVYVQRFPELGQRVAVSTGGGRQPLWSADGRELFYRTPRGVVVTPVELAPTFKAGVPEVLFDDQYFFYLSRRTWDVTPDGERFLVLKPTEADADDPFAGLTRIHVVQNWLTELERLVPTP